jgi:iron complex outermembrane receptor protein
VADDGAARLKDLSLEELFAVEVTSTTRWGESLARTPAAMSVVRGNDLRRFGVRRLPEALRLAMGLHVAFDDNQTWAISARGFNLTSANKMLVLIDGRSVYTPLFAGVFWDVQGTLLADVDRIEVIRGPLPILWGANAVNGVINIITRSAAETQGGLAELGAGTEDRFAGVRWGGDLGEGHYRLWASHDEYGASALADDRSAEDEVALSRAGFRLDLPLADETDLSVHGGAYFGSLEQDGATEDADVDGAHVVGEWRRRTEGKELIVRGYLDHSFRRIPELFQEDRNTANFELQHRRRIGRHWLTWGGDLRLSEDDVVDSEVIGWDPSSYTSWTGGGFVRDEVTLLPELSVIAGLRLEDQSTMNLELQPELRVLWTPSPRRSFWVAGSRAVRAPTRLDRDLRVPGVGEPQILGSKRFRAEEVVAYELGSRFRIGERLGVSLVAFTADYDDLRSQDRAGPGEPIVLGNRLEGETHGIEAGVAYDFSRRWRLVGAVTWLDKDLRLEPGSSDPIAGAAEGNDPDYHGHLRLYADLTDDVSFAFMLRHVGSLPSPPVPAYTELDLSVRWSPLPGFELGLVGRNLLHDRHPEFGAAATRRELERSALLSATWRF